MKRNPSMVGYENSLKHSLMKDLDGSSALIGFYLDGMIVGYEICRSE